MHSGPLKYPGRALVAAGAVAAVCAGVLGTGIVPDSAAATHYSSSGTITLSGAITGTLKVPATINNGALPGCSISVVYAPGRKLGGYEIMSWTDPPGLKIKGKTTAAFVELAVDDPLFGQSYAVKPSGIQLHGAMTVSADGSYQGESGTVTVAAGGATGSVDGVAKGPAGSVTVKGQWSGCAKTPDE